MYTRTVLVVGGGSIGHRHARLLSRRKDLALWICDPAVANLESVSRQVQVEKSFQNLGRALQERPDFVWVCTPESLHADVSVSALEQGTHVFCEKPLADNLKAANRIREAVSRSGRVFAVGYVLRYVRAFKTIKSLIEQEAIGTVVGGYVCVGTYETLVNAKSDSYLKQPGGLLLTYTHEIDYLRWFLGAINKATGFVACLGDVDRKPDPNVAGCVFQFQSGALVTVYLDYVQNPGVRSITLIGDKGKISYASTQTHVDIFKYGSQSSDPIDVTQEQDKAFEEEHDMFFRAVENQPSELVNVHDAYETLMIVSLLLKESSERP